MEDRILIVDDEEHILRALKRTLMDEDYVIDKALDGEEALEMIGKRPYKVVISDERMPGMLGSELLAMISLRRPEVVKIMLTGHASVEAAMNAVNQGEICRFLLKPWDNSELRMAVRAGIEKYNLEMQNRQLLALIRTQTLKLRAGRQVDDLTAELLNSLAAQSEPGSQPLINSQMAEILDECMKKT